MTKMKASHPVTADTHLEAIDQLLAEHPRTQVWLDLPKYASVAVSRRWGADRDVVIQFGRFHHLGTSEVERTEVADGAWVGARSRLVDCVLAEGALVREVDAERCTFGAASKVVGCTLRDVTVPAGARVGWVRQAEVLRDDHVAVWGERTTLFRGPGGRAFLDNGSWTGTLPEDAGRLHPEARAMFLAAVERW